MAYSTVAEVQAEFKSLDISASTPISTADATRFIEEADAEINARIGLRFVTPLTGAQSLIIARKLSIMLVSQRIKEILRVQSGSKELDQETRDANLRKDAFALMDKIIAGQFLLSDATLRSSADGVRSFVVDEGFEHTFERDVEQW